MYYNKIYNNYFLEFIYIIIYICDDGAAILRKVWELWHDFFIPKINQVRLVERGLAIKIIDFALNHFARRLRISHFSPAIDWFECYRKIVSDVSNEILNHILVSLQ
jgi:hypothetical protein